MKGETTVERVGANAAAMRSDAVRADAAANRQQREDEATITGRKPAAERNTSGIADVMRRAIGGSKDHRKPGHGAYRG